MLVQFFAGTDEIIHREYWEQYRLYRSLFGTPSTACPAPSPDMEDKKVQRGPTRLPLGPLVPAAAETTTPGPLERIEAVHHTVLGQAIVETAVSVAEGVELFAYLHRAQHLGKACCCRAPCRTVRRQGST